MIPAELLRKIRGIEIRSRHIVTDVLAGQYHSAFKGSGMEFEEVREYQPGDEVRAIDWNVTARMQGPFIKTYREERELTVVLLVDMSASLDFGSQQKTKRELAAEVAAVLALVAIRNQDNVALLLYTDQVEHYIPAGKGPRHVLRVVRDILGFEPQGKGTDLQPALTFLHRVLHRKAVVFWIGDGHIPLESMEAAKRTGRRHDLVALRLDDPGEVDWASVGLLEWQDPETGERVLVDTSSKKVQKALKRMQSEWAETQEREHTRGGIDLLSLNTGEPYERELAKFFRLRARRRV